MKVPCFWGIIEGFPCKASLYWLAYWCFKSKGTQGKELFFWIWDWKNGQARFVLDEEKEVLITKVKSQAVLPIHSVLQSLHCWHCCFTTKSHISDSVWATSWENLFMPYANNKGADQPVRPRSLISAFVIHCLGSIISVVSVCKISSL